MESTSDVQMQHCAEDSETTIEIKIKTLDSQTYNLRVNKCVPVPLLKEKIATVTGILSEQQRLICRGRVLKDDELLSAYHVEDGHTLHLVVRQPGQSAPSGSAGTEANASNSGRRRGPTVARSVVLEAVNVDPGSSELPAFVAQILQSVLGSISAQSSGAPASSDTRPSEPTQSSIPNTVIPDALTTMSQYIDFMRDSFRREGFNHNGQAEGNVENRTAGSTSVGGTQNQETQPESTSTLGLHTASLLAETMHSTRQIVVEQAGALLSQLSAQLGDLQNVTDPATRRDLQSSAFRSGSLLQNLGSLLLELGRTTMLLRINPASSEAVVNSGPALYISPSGPNPLMVQPVPFFPGRSVQMGTLFSGLGSQGSVLHPRDVDIHVRTGGSVPVASTNPSETAGAQANRTGEVSHANIGEASAGVAGGTPFSVESGVRLLPLRTVVAMPAGISRAPSGSSSGGVGIIYPLITRVRQRANTIGNDERNGQSPNEPARSSTHPNQQSIPQSSQAHEAGNLESVADVNVGNGSETSPGQQNGLVTLSQIMDLLGSMLPGENVRGNSSSQQAPTSSAEQVDGRNSATTQVSGASEEALHFASMVRQIMPFISQVETQNQSAPPDTSSTHAQAASGSANRARDDPRDSTSSHQHNRDQIDEPNSKRQRFSD
ncbi:ubiquitin-like domain-containing protein CIP73 isoform X1 [Setaria viridis]|uniref:Ubiquitin-like domain-containing protein n=1 Tax=Setaria viridis TaxID=4556 RepID=A0A4U6VQ41_SETVI|nr:ubiquitin-like domain-containing protein CIP73 isoform X2 [Setaria viridis]TKW30583.1 hypothetical protein SEVIR_2G047700v2 [Setaria viridis]TKW30586.1 hypothetical protein SEVIR_2G047700v2 [Setaria viridis]